MSTRGVSLADVIRVAAHDLFGTKDVQNPITASYVWLADQTGHVFLGLAPTLLCAWGWQAIAGMLQVTTILYWIGLAVIGLGWLGLWCWKEISDFWQAHQQAGNRFPFDVSDLWNNIYTALFYIGAGIVFAFTAFVHVSVLLGALLLLVPVAVVIAVWWLRRKIAFQQAALPYLFRLADFTGQVASMDMIAAVTALTRPDVAPPTAAAPLRHAIIRGPIGAGKTALVAGIGTEYAFALGRGRYVTMMDLLQQADVAKPNPAGPQTETRDGRVLWTWDTAELLIVDDLDAGLQDTTLVTPDAFRSAITALLGNTAPLGFLACRKSVWVLGLSADAVAWRGVLADLIGLPVDQIADVALTQPAMA